MEFLGIVRFSFTTYYEKEVEKEKCPYVKLANKRKKRPHGAFFYGGRGTRTPKPDGGGFQDR